MTKAPFNAPLPAACLLPASWQYKAAWRVLEIDAPNPKGFLSIWAAWRNDSYRSRMLHCVVITPNQLAFSTSSSDLADPEASLADELAQHTWGLMAGIHRLSLDGGYVLLTICIGMPSVLLRQQQWAFDSIFWWSGDHQDAEARTRQLKGVARCCAPDALLAIEGVSPTLKSLAECGFVTEQRGSIDAVAHYRYVNFRKVRTPQRRRGATTTQPARCIVLGAGLCGASVAASLARRGWQVTVLDAGDAPACGASGLPVGLFLPNVSTDDNLVARISRAGVRATLEQCARLLNSGTDWLASGVVERRPDGKPGWPPHRDANSDALFGEAQDDWARAASPEEIKAAGLPVGTSAIRHMRAGWVKPATLVRALLAQPGIQFRANSAAHALERTPTIGTHSISASTWRVLGADGAVLGEAELIVVASGPASASLLESAGLGELPFDAIRGQLSWGMQTDGMALPALPANGLGALIAHIPVQGGLAWHAGSTFERGAIRLPVPADEQKSGHAANFENLQGLAPQAAQSLAPWFIHHVEGLRHWAGVRCAMLDRLPLVGPVAPQSHPGLLVCTGMGARGLSRAVLCGELIAAQLHGEPLPLETRLANALAADRFEVHGA